MIIYINNTIIITIKITTTIIIKIISFTLIIIFKPFRKNVNISLFNCFTKRETDDIDDCCRRESVVPEALCQGGFKRLCMGLREGSGVNDDLGGNPISLFWKIFVPVIL